MIKALFIDFDGTLFSHRKHEIPASALKAIDLARSSGVMVFLCTGRAKPEFANFDISMLKIDGMVLCNGQVVIDDKDNIIYDNPIKGRLKQRIVDIYVNNILPIYFANNDKLFLNFVNDRIIKVQSAISSEIPELAQYNGEKIYMASAFYDNKEELALLNALKDEAEVTYWHDGALDIVPKGTSKTSGIKHALKILNIDIEDTMGIGDGDNDLDMLKACGIGVAMGNSIDSIKEAADYVTEDIDEDGLYNALKHFGVI